MGSQGGGVRAGGGLCWSWRQSRGREIGVLSGEVKHEKV